MSAHKANSRYNTIAIPQGQVAPSPLAGFFLPGLDIHIPQTNGRIGAAADQLFSIRRKGHAVHCTRVPE